MFYHLQNKRKKPYTVEMVMQNTSTFGILFKVKCTSNKRIKLEHCAEILGPDEEVSVSFTRNDINGETEDEIVIVYALVGDCWVPQEKRNAFQVRFKFKKKINLNFIGSSFTIQT